MCIPVSSEKKKEKKKLFMYRQNSIKLSEINANSIVLSEKFFSFFFVLSVKLKISQWSKKILTKKKLSFFLFEILVFSTDF